MRKRFYARYIPTEEDLAKVKNLIDYRQFEEAKMCLDYLSEEIPMVTITDGKVVKKHPLTESFLNREDIEFVDENGIVYTKSELGL